MNVRSSDAPSRAPTGEDRTAYRREGDKKSDVGAGATQSFQFVSIFLLRILVFQYSIDF